MSDPVRMPASYDEDLAREPENDPLGLLPEGSHLAYVVGGEAYYFDLNGEEYINIVSNDDAGDGCDWSFTIKAHDLQRAGGLRLELFEDAFVALAQIPAFFEQLPGMTKLTEVRSALESMKAADITPRQRPGNGPAGWTAQQIKDGGFAPGTRFVLASEALAAGNATR